MENSMVDSLANHEHIKDDVIKLSGAKNKLMEADSVPSEDNIDAYSWSKIVSERQNFTGQLMNDFSCSEYLDTNELREEPKTAQDPSTEANLADSSCQSKEQFESDSNGFDTKARTGRRTRNGSDSLLRLLLKEKSKANAEAENMHEIADSVSKGSAVSTFSRQITFALSEYENPSFSASSPPTGLLSFSIPYSGSISQRSNSTASTRSFAFPILATDWNDSPARMAEADQRHLKKSKWCGWGTCFNCCRI